MNEMVALRTPGVRTLGLLFCKLRKPTQGRFARLLGLSSNNILNIEFLYALYFANCGHPANAFNVLQSVRVNFLHNYSQFSMCVSTFSVRMFEEKSHFSLFVCAKKVIFHFDRKRARIPFFEDNCKNPQLLICEKYELLHYSRI